MILSQDIFIHLHGFSIGLYIATFFLLVLFSVSYYNKAHNQITIMLLLLAITSAVCGFYNVYTYKLNAGALVDLIPSEVMFIGKHSMPFACILFIFIHTSVLARTNLTTYRIIIKTRMFLYTIYFLLFISFILLFTTDDVVKVITVNHLDVLITVLLSMYLTVKTRQQFSYTPLVLAIMCVVMVNVFLLLYTLNVSKIESRASFNLISSMMYSVFFILYSLQIIRIVHVKAKHMGSLKSHYQQDIVIDLHKAIENENLYMVYQPKLCLQTNKVSGLEALIRWNHPKRGHISPGYFIPIVEKRGMINDVSMWVIETVLKQAVEFQRQNLFIPIALNLSTENLNNQVVGFLEKKIHELKLDVRMISIEITETFFLTMDSERYNALEKLKQLKIALSMDDYGTGYSSLSYIKQLSLTELKIDSTFIRNLDTCQDSRVIVTSIIQMCTALNIGVTAEGVETQVIKDMLEQLGCHTIQGYYLSKPNSIPNLIQWMQETDTLPTNTLDNT